MKSAIFPKVPPKMDPVLSNSEGDENGIYFLKLLKAENEKLQWEVSKAERELEKRRNLSEEATGQLRIATGKAKLLMDKKFHQFEELCRKNLEASQDEPFSVTDDDLAGYWDMVKIQISHVHGIFQHSYELMNSN